MPRDRVLAAIAAACTAVAAVFALTMGAVLMHTGTAEAAQRDVLDAAERAYEPPAQEAAVQDEPETEWVESAPEPETEPALEEPTWEEPVYMEPAYVDPVYDYSEPDYSYVEPTYVSTDGLTAQGGVNYYGGRTETYYSSNVLPHYRLGEWTVDDEGFWRTDDGYYVVAAPDMEQGTVFEGSKGQCIVLDCGCDYGVTDYYVAW